MKKILTALIALALVMPVAAEAGNKHWKRHNNNWNGNVYNCYNCYYKKNNNNNNINGWGVGAGILGGVLLGGIIANQNNYPPPGYYVQGVRCQLWDPYSQQYIWAQGEICVR